MTHAQHTPTRPVHDSSEGAGVDLWVAAAWGAAEATFFVLVPDVWLSWVAARSPRRAPGAVFAALAGAMAGGVVTRTWGARVDADRSARALAALPAISRRMVAGVEADLAQEGHRALLTGPRRGIPYKLYARASGLQGRDLGSFLAWTVPARTARFVAVTAIGAVGGILARRGRPRTWRRDARAVHAVAWTAFYAWFFSTVGRDEGEPTDPHTP